MNVNKTKTWKFGRRQKLKNSDHLTLYVDDRLVECVPSYKYLGTYLDSDLNFIRQSNETIKFISYKLFYLGKIKCFLNTEILLRLYRAYIQLYFDYNDIFLDVTTVRQYDKLIRLQRRRLRRCLPENVKVDRNEVYSRTGINRLKSDVQKSPM